MSGPKLCLKYTGSLRVRLLGVIGEGTSPTRCTLDDNRLKKSDLEIEDKRVALGSSLPDSIRANFMTAVGAHDAAKEVLVKLRAALGASMPAEPVHDESALETPEKFYWGLFETLQQAVANIDGRDTSPGALPSKALVDTVIGGAEKMLAKLKKIKGMSSQAAARARWTPKQVDTLEELIVEGGLKGAQEALPERTRESIEAQMRVLFETKYKKDHDTFKRSFPLLVDDTTFVI